MISTAVFFFSKVEKIIVIALNMFCTCDYFKNKFRITVKLLDNFVVKNS